jgi:hypothetical protein
MKVFKKTYKTPSHIFGYMLEPNRENWPYFQKELKFRNLVTRKPEKNTHTFLAILNFLKNQLIKFSHVNG